MADEPEGAAAPPSAVSRAPAAAWLIVALLVAALACVGVVAVIALRPAPVGPADRLFDVPGSGDETPLSLTTSDRSEAARWLSERIGAKVAPVDLHEAGAALVGAQAFPSARRGALHFEDRRGVLISLHVLAAPGGPIEALPERVVGSHRFRVGRTSHPSLSLVAWRAGPVTLVAASPIGLEDLLPFAELMAAQWRSALLGEARARRPGPGRGRTD